MLTMANTPTWQSHLTKLHKLSFTFTNLKITRLCLIRDASYYRETSNRRMNSRHHKAPLLNKSEEPRVSTLLREYQIRCSQHNQNKPQLVVHPFVDTCWQRNWHSFHPTPLSGCRMKLGPIPRSSSVQICDYGYSIINGLKPSPPLQ